MDEEEDPIVVDEEDNDNPLPIEILLALGYELDHQNNKGQTPLHVAVLYDNIKIAQCLLGHGADVSIEDNDGNTALHLAAFHEEKQPSRGNSSLYEKRLLMVKALIEFDSDVDARNLTGQTPLMRAVREGHLCIVNYLVQCGADTEAQDVDGDTALHLAVFHESEDEESLCIVRSLLENGSDVNALNFRNETPLMKAVKGWHFGIVQELLEWYPDLSVKNVYGQTCLHILYEGAPGKTDLMIKLVKAGAPIQTVDEQGQAAVHYILQRKAPRWVNIEEAKEFVKIASFVNNKERINFLLDGDLERYANECDAEIIKMRSISCGSTSNLLDFGLHGREVATNSIEEKVVSESAFQTMARETFRIYDDCLQFHFQRTYLFEKLKQKRILVKNDPTETEFPSFLIPDLYIFLSKEDLFSLLRASNY